MVADPLTPKHRELCEAKSSNAIADKVKSPKKVKNTKLCLIKDTSEQSPSAKAMPGKGLQANSGSATKNTNVKSLQVILIPLGFQSSRLCIFVSSCPGPAAFCCLFFFFPGFC